jgi:hypothetical protein
MQGPIMQRLAANIAATQSGKVPSSVKAPANSTYHAYVSGTLTQFQHNYQPSFAPNGSFLGFHDAAPKPPSDVAIIHAVPTVNLNQGKAV